MPVRKVVDLSGQDDCIDEESGKAVKSMRIGSATNDNYRSGLKKICEYYQQSKKWRQFVVPDEENPDLAYPFKLLIPVPLESIVACFGYYATKPVKGAARKRSKPSKKKGRKKKGRKKKRPKIQGTSVCEDSEDEDCDEEDSVAVYSESDDDFESTPSHPPLTTGNRAMKIRRYANSSSGYEEVDDEAQEEAQEETLDSVAIADISEEYKFIKNIDKPTLSYSSISGYHSAFKNYFKIKDIEFRDPAIPDGKPNYISFFDGFLQAYKKVIGEKKESGVMSIHEGKNVLTPQGYWELNWAFIKFIPERRSTLSALAGLFGWACSSASWNNCCRSEMLDRLHACHFDWVNDGMKIVLVRNKKDQTSTGQGKERMLYCNIKDPVVCGILPVALWAMCKESNCEQDCRSEKFFNGDDQKQKYRTFLNKIYETFNQDDDIDVEILFGSAVEDLGTHSHRKGSVTMLLGIIDGPNPCAVYIRAGWSLGNTQDRYVMGGAGEDELCGRLLAMLNLADEDFGCLPPHFDAQGLSILNEIGYDRLLKGYSSHSPGYKRCIPHWIAIILYHLDTLKQWWKPDHPVWGALFFQTINADNKMEELISHIQLGHFSNSITKMTASGVPLIVKLLHGQQRSHDALAQMIVASEDKIISSLIPAIQQIPDTIDKTWNSRVNGCDTVTMTDLNEVITANTQAIIATVQQQLHDSMQQVIAQVSTSQPQRQQSDHLDESVETITMGCVHTREGEDGLYFSPPHFQMPKCDCTKLFRMWHFGKALPVAMGPLKTLYENYKHELTISNRALMAKAAIVMRKMESIYFSEDKNIGHAITLQNGEQVCEDTLHILIGQLYPVKVPKTWKSHCYTTICKKISQVNSANAKARLEFPTE